MKYKVYVSIHLFFLKEEKESHLTNNKNVCITTNIKDYLRPFPLFATNIS